MAGIGSVSKANMEEIQINGRDNQKVIAGETRSEVVDNTRSEAQHERMSLERVSNTCLDFRLWRNSC